MITAITVITKNKRKRRENTRKTGRRRICVEEIGNKETDKDHYDKVQKNEEENKKIRNNLIILMETIHKHSLGNCLLSDVCLINTVFRNLAPLPSFSDNSTVKPLIFAPLDERFIFLFLREDSGI
jgi:hypothetical protein